MSDTPCRVAVCWLLPELEQPARDLAARLQLPVATADSIEAELLLRLGGDGLSLQATGADAPGAVRVDFVEGALAHRRQFGGGAGQMVAKAVGLRGAVRPTVLDATAGLGRDAFVLASLGCEVTLIERQPIIAALLEDGLQRAREAGGEVAEIAERMTLIQGDAITFMAQWAAAAPQVIHLDPMFPHREKSALVKKEMRLFRPLAGDDLDAPALLAAAWALASHRVAVKRPRKAPSIDGPPPSAQLSGQSSRYDIYGKKKLG
ncbi:SAM-dependent methyltransferase [Pseudomonas saudimassiliensis]|uniref:Ribosomal RNA small subunit methyltransferase J n=1 Tax=Pseudomonas saudimassiliensis TaxID=1461581 RepID=A0A078M4B4_9PSED|nr:class I SAM-dependent methyltransferase [Pseudomonas saudimassiliensis]CEA01120.1 SAM-dependent methyltransferase [Pseudomonas saudimassiliensis]CEF25404.1 SAM-dependent methyltransferase [Pseudomonas saudimassiliensis]